MSDTSPATAQDILNRQHAHWDRVFAAHPDLLGAEASVAARWAAARFAAEGVTHVLELGAGQGRDTLSFAHAGVRVCALDYSAVGLAAIRRKAEALGLAGRVTAVAHDVRRPLPFPDGAFEACSSHMLWCMALTLADLEALAREVWRVLRPGGLNVYTVRHVGDPHFGVGPHRGENRYEDPAGGFIVHFFSRELVEHLAEGYDLLEVEPFEEGTLPRKLFRVTLRKPTAARSFTSS